MGRKSRILRRINKFGSKFVNHPRLKKPNKQESTFSLVPSIEEKIEVLEEEINPVFELEVEEKPKRIAPIKKPNYSNTSKPKK